MSNVTKIKVGEQKQANKPVYLLPTGAIECGRFLYQGRYKRKFKSFFNKICLLALREHKGGVLDVSDYKYWDAIRIYRDYVVAGSYTSITAVQLEKFACETAIAIMLEEVKPEFKRAVELKWKKQFKKSDPNDPKTPFEAWQIL